MVNLVILKIYAFPVENIQLIQAKQFAFGTLNMRETQACNRAICFLQKPIQMPSLG